MSALGLGFNRSTQQIGQTTHFEYLVCDRQWSCLFERGKPDRLNTCLNKYQAYVRIKGQLVNITVFADTSVDATYSTQFHPTPQLSGRIESEGVKR